MESIDPREGDNVNERQQLNQISSSSSLVAEKGEEYQNGSLLQENGTTAANIRAANITNNTYMGKHRLTAAITQINHQIQIIQEELDELETLGQSSLVCRELVTAVESIPDALLPEIRGPAIVGWDRWFQGSSRARKRWI